jgi:hypothetical protein
MGHLYNGYVSHSQRVISGSCHPISKLPQMDSTGPPGPPGPPDWMDFLRLADTPWKAATLGPANRPPQWLRLDLFSLNHCRHCIFIMYDSIIIS